MLAYTMRVFRVWHAKVHDRRELWRDDISSVSMPSLFHVVVFNSLHFWLFFFHLSSIILCRATFSPSQLNTILTIKSFIFASGCIFHPNGSQSVDLFTNSTQKNAIQMHLPQFLHWKKQSNRYFLFHFNFQRHRSPNSLDCIWKTFSMSDDWVLSSFGKRIGRWLLSLSVQHKHKQNFPAPITQNIFFKNTTETHPLDEEPAPHRWITRSNNESTASEL